jgi:8-oxo-dGTP diphosphatase
MSNNNFKYKLSARGIIINDDSILLNEFGGGKYYNIPGGTVKKHETIKEAAIREVKEESGLVVLIRDFLFVLEYEPKHCNYFFGNMHTVSFVFRCNVIGNMDILSPTVVDKDPHDKTIFSTGCKWIKIVDLDNIEFVPYINNELRQYIKSGTFKPNYLEEILHKNGNYSDESHAKS